MSDNASWWAGALSGAGVALVTAISAVFTRRNSRVSRLEREVALCKQRDASVVVLKAGFRLIVGALERREPGSPELQICRDLLNRHLPITLEDRDLERFEDLLTELDKEEKP